MMTVSGRMQPRRLGHGVNPVLAAVALLAVLPACQASDGPPVLIVNHDSLSLEGKGPMSEERLWAAIGVGEPSELLVRRSQGVSNRRVLEALFDVPITSRGRDRLRLQVEDRAGNSHEVAWTRAVWIHIGPQGQLLVSLGDAGFSSLPNSAEVEAFLTAVATASSGEIETTVVSADEAPQDAVRAVEEAVEQSSFTGEVVLWAE